MNYSEVDKRKLIKNKDHSLNQMRVIEERALSPDLIEVQPAKESNNSENYNTKKEMQLEEDEVAFDDDFED